ncbi:MAG: sensor histidine kinase [Novosphingobium sp.]|jgi:two-component system NarL family sensor kinase|uniref:sensor histidine kinase n=1 Tax=Novosphingobium sp. TaxID=1874826 RepID=UPI003B9C72DD
MVPPATSDLPQRAADLRALYRAAEARAARLRVLVEAGQALAAATSDTMDAAVADVARSAAHLAGYATGRVVGGEGIGPDGDDHLSLPLTAPGGDGSSVGALVLEGRRGTLSADDRETLAILCQLIGASLSARAREARLTRLLGELLRSQEVERSRIAHELHDGVAQSAAALMRRLELAEDGDSRDLAKARDQSRELVGELRRVIAGMRPPVLDDLGLVPALHQLAAEAEEDGLTVVVQIAPKAGMLRPPPVFETALFRVVQEALSNVRAHAGPQVCVNVRLETDAGIWWLEVRDDGCGFDPNAPRPAGAAGGLGLAYMRERIALLGGKLTIASAPGAGCTLLAEIAAT